MLSVHGECVIFQSVGGELYAEVLINQVVESTESAIGEEQCGFRKDSSSDATLARLSHAVIIGGARQGRFACFYWIFLEA